MYRMFQKSGPSHVLYDFAPLPKKDSCGRYNFEIVTPIEYHMKYKDKQKEKKFNGESP